MDGEVVIESRKDRQDRTEGGLSSPPCISQGGLESPPSVIQFSLFLRRFALFLTCVALGSMVARSHS